MTKLEYGQEKVKDGTEHEKKESETKQHTSCLASDKSSNDNNSAATPSGGRKSGSI